MAKKNHEIRVKLSGNELKKISEKSESAGMRPSVYLRFLGLKSKVNVLSE